MRILVIAYAVLALAAVPCAWDSTPGEPPPVAALFSLLLPAADAGSQQPAQIAKASSVASDNLLLQHANY